MKPDALSQQFNTTEEEEDPELILAPSYLVGAIFWETKNAIYAFPIFSMCPKSSLYAPARCALSSPVCPLSKPLFWLCSPSPSLSSLCLGGAHCELSLLAHAPAPKHTLVIHLVLWPLLKAVALISLLLDY